MHPIVHKVQKRIYYEHTDAAGVVYYARYLNFLEQARTEVLRKYGFNHKNLLKEHNLIFVVKKIELDYLKAIELDDLIEIHSTIVEFSQASFHFEQNIYNLSNNQIALKSRVKIACLNSQFKPIKLPKMLKIALSDNQN